MVRSRSRRRPRSRPGPPPRPRARTSRSRTSRKHSTARTTTSRSDLVFSHVLCQGAESVRHPDCRWSPATRSLMRSCALLVGILALTACRRPGPAHPLAAEAPDTAALAREVPGFLRSSGVPGLSMAVVREGRVVWAGAFGTRGDSAQTPVDSATVFEAASLSKPVFAYLVLRLADRGVLDLDRPLADVLEYPRLAHDGRARRITARMV